MLLPLSTLAFLCLSHDPCRSSAQGGIASPTEPEVESDAGTHAGSEDTLLGPMGAEARRSYEQGLAHYAAHDFARAIQSFEAGYAIDPRREFLFAEAQAFRLDGDCAHATSFYRRFLATRPPAIQIEATELGLARCAAMPATAPSAAPTLAPAPLAPGRARESTDGGPTVETPPRPSIITRPAAPPVALSTARRLLRDPWTTGAVASGLLALGAGVSFWVAADRARARADSSRTSTYDEFASASRSFEQRRGIAVAALSAGSALLLCGLGRAWWVTEHGAAAPRAAVVFDGRRLSWSTVY